MENFEGNSLMSTYFENKLDYNLNEFLWFLDYSLNELLWFLETYEEFHELDQPDIYPSSGCY